LLYLSSSGAKGAWPWSHIDDTSPQASRVCPLPLKPTWRSKVQGKTFPICRNSRRSAASTTSVGAKLSCQGHLHLRDRQSGSLGGFLLAPAKEIPQATSEAINKASLAASY
jgi:hypothetical protein